jgi:hypothetical protein
MGRNPQVSSTTITVAATIIATITSNTYYCCCCYICYLSPLARIQPQEDQLTIYT